MPIIGKGDIANALRDREDRLYFASGVSNSRELRESEFQREIDLLMAQDKNRHLVYFSSLSVFYTDIRYAQHKKAMESLVKKEFPHYTLIRLGNIAWGNNPNTLINFFKNKKSKGEAFEVKDVYRFVIEKEDFLFWMEMIPDWNCEMNLPGQRMKVRDIIEKYV